jgi:hypothetical protein
MQNIHQTLAKKTPPRAQLCNRSCSNKTLSHSHFFARGPAVRATDVHIIRGRTGKRTTAPTMPKHLLKIKHGETLRRISLDAIMTHEAL